MFRGTDLPNFTSLKEVETFFSVSFARILRRVVVVGGGDDIFLLVRLHRFALIVNYHFVIFLKKNYKLVLN